MKRFLVILSLLTAVFSHADISKKNEIFFADLGDRTSATINTMLGKKSDWEERTFVLSGGEWSITNAVTFPTNCSLRIEYGSKFNVATNINVALQYVNLEAGDYEIFTGDGTATGDANFIYRWPNWGDTTDFDIGDGVLTESQIETWIENGDLTFAGGTTQRFDNAIVTNLAATNLNVSGNATVEGGFTANGTATFNSNMVFGAAASNSIENVVSNTPGFGATAEWSENPAVTNVDFASFIAQNVKDITTTGGVSVISPYGFEAKSGIAQTINLSTWTKLLMTNELWDVGSVYDPSTTKFTVPAGGAGKWYLRIQLSINELTNSRDLWGRIYKNGSTAISEAYITSGTDGDHTICVAGIFELDVGDYIEPFVQHSHSPSESTEANKSWMYGYWMGE